MKEDGNYNTKNLSKAEMEEARRLKKKRTATEAVDTKVLVTPSTDLNKKRKTTDEAAVQNDSKPWEGKEEQDQDYRWDICENCQ